ncbi:hypothetical protein ABE504_18810 [Paenibacillus oryzisoli]|uniref:hypothetical protein n=1 Tax=Paenibacillus oryzisoli TaxID=1850517 RepID=UPI003D2B1EEA
MLKKKERRVPVGNRTSEQGYPRISFQQALDFVMSVKRAEGLRERTLKDYEKHFGYFLNWLTDKYPEIEFVDELTSTIFRQLFTVEVCKLYIYI